MITTRAPGKLFIAGEYAVVDPGEPACLVAVDRYLTVRLTAAAGHGTVRSGASLFRWRFEGERVVGIEGHNDYVLAAIAAVEELRAERGLPREYFDLSISTELVDDDGTKLGLGSSAAVTAAIVSAAAEFHGLGLTDEERFRLALLATIEVSPTASGGDLAASTYGGWLHYTSPDRAALRGHRNWRGVAETLHCPEWADSGVTQLPEPHSLQLLVGWTGTPASTPALVGSARRERDAAAHAEFVAASRACVEELTAGIRLDDEAALGPVRTARRLLQGLAADTGVEIETEALRLLCDVAEAQGAAAKPSGAGGGDCGIALAPLSLSGVGILRAWESHGIRPLELSVARGGGHDF